MNDLSTIFLLKFTLPDLLMLIILLSLRVKEEKEEERKKERKLVIKDINTIRLFEDSVIILMHVELDRLILSVFFSQGSRLIVLNVSS